MTAKDLFGVIVRAFGLAVIVFGLYQLASVSAIKTALGPYKPPIIGLPAKDFSLSGDASVFDYPVRAATRIGVLSLVVGTGLLAAAPLIAAICYWSLPGRGNRGPRIASEMGGAPTNISPV